MPTSTKATWSATTLTPIARPALATSPSIRAGRPPCDGEVLELDEQTVGEQVLGELGHEGRRDTERAGELGAGCRTLRTEVREDRRAVDVGAGGGPDHH